MKRLRRNELSNGLVVWQAEGLLALGAIHAFTTRHGGSSSGACATLDLAGRGTREGVALENARENLTRLRAGLGVPASARTLGLHQIHGAEVISDDGAPAGWPPPRGDVLTSDRSDALLMVRTADCVPILLHDPENGAVAAVHSGWRGTVADAPGAAVRRLVDRHGTNPSELHAAIGPCIGRDRFEVGAEVAEAFHDAGLGTCVESRTPKPHIDLFRSVRRRLLDAGLDPERVEGTPICTHAEVADCFSHRRQGPTGGRMAGVILAPPRPGRNAHRGA